MKLHITTHSGKMKGIESISTSTKHNRFCQAAQKKEGSVCTKCYAKNYEAMRPSLVTALERNSTALREVLPPEDLPYINASIFRFSSFGELINVNHTINLLNITYKNPHVMFALWTKRPNLVQAAIRKVGLPDNINLIYSAPMIDRKPKLPKNFTKTFTVYSKGSTQEINCGAKSCVTCRLCYTKNNITEVSERVR